MNNILLEPYTFEDMIEDNNKEKYFYNQEFKTKLFIINQFLKNVYSQIRNELQKYQVVRQVGTSAEEYFYNNQKIFRITLFDRSLRLYINTINKHLIDYSKNYGYEQTNKLLIINTNDTLLQSLELIREVMNEHNIPLNKKFKQYDYVSDITLKSSWQLSLTKQKGEVLSYATIDDASLLSDKEALNCLVYEESLQLINNSVVGYITIGEITAAFNENYIVDMELLKATNLIDNAVTFLKIINGGQCYHKISVVANDYDIECLKMIVLTGGNAVKLI